MLFGDRLRMLREEKEITQKQLGAIINISDRVIGYYESNNRFPKDETILKDLAAFFHCSIDYLVGNSDIRNPYHKEVIQANNIDLSGLPEEVVRQVQDYVEFLRQKYGSPTTKK